MTGASSPLEKVRGYCPDCGPNRWANVQGQFEKNEEDGGVWAKTTYRILECPACEEVYFQTDHIFSEDYDYSESALGEMEVEYNHKIEHWPYNPPNARRRPDWIDKLIRRDEDIHSLLNSVYGALDSDLSVLAAIGIRTVFDRASELLGVHPSETFAGKLEKLMVKGKIGADQRRTLEVLTDAGSAAAHRGWRPSSEELDTMMSVIETFLHNAFILEEDVRKLKAGVPERQKLSVPKS